MAKHKIKSVMSTQHTHYNITPACLSFFFQAYYPIMQIYIPAH